MPRQSLDGLQRSDDWRAAALIATIAQSGKEACASGRPGDPSKAFERRRWKWRRRRGPEGFMEDRGDVWNAILTTKRRGW